MAWYGGTVAYMHEGKPCPIPIPPIQSSPIPIPALALGAFCTGQYFFLHWRPPTILAKHTTTPTTPTLTTPSFSPYIPDKANGHISAQPLHLPKVYPAGNVRPARPARMRPLEDPSFPSADRNLPFSASCLVNIWPGDCEIQLHQIRQVSGLTNQTLLIQQSHARRADVPTQPLQLPNVCPTPTTAQSLR